MFCIASIVELYSYIIILRGLKLLEKMIALNEVFLGNSLLQVITADYITFSIRSFKPYFSSHFTLTSAFWSLSRRAPSLLISNDLNPMIVQLPFMIFMSTSPQNEHDLVEKNHWKSLPQRTCKFCCARISKVSRAMVAKGVSRPWEKPHTRC